MNAPAVYDLDAHYRATNLRVNSDLVAKARSLNINLSREFEAHLSEVVRQRVAERWLADNRQAFQDYNRLIEQICLFSDGQRAF